MSPLELDAPFAGADNSAAETASRADAGADAPLTMFNADAPPADAQDDFLIDEVFSAM